MPSPWGNDKYSAFAQPDTHKVRYDPAHINVRQGLISGAMSTPWAEAILGNKVVEASVGKKVKFALRGAAWMKGMATNEVAEQLTGDQDDSLSDLIGDGLVVGGSILAGVLTPVGWGAAAAWGIGTLAGIGGSFLKDIITGDDQNKSNSPGDQRGNYLNGSSSIAIEGAAESAVNECTHYGDNNDGQYSGYRQQVNSYGFSSDHLFDSFDDGSYQGHEADQETQESSTDESVGTPTRGASTSSQHRNLEGQQRTHSGQEDGAQNQSHAASSVRNTSSPGATSESNGQDVSGETQNDEGTSWSQSTTEDGRYPHHWFKGNDGGEEKYGERTYEKETDEDGNETGRWRTRTRIGEEDENDEGEVHEEYVGEPFEDEDTDGDGVPDSYDEAPEDGEAWMENPIRENPGNQESRFKDVITGSDPETNWGPDGKPGGGSSTFGEDIFDADPVINWGPDAYQKTENSKMVDAIIGADVDINWGPESEPGSQNGAYEIFDPAVEGLGGINPRISYSDNGISSFQSSASDLIGGSSNSLQLLATQDFM